MFTGFHERRGATPTCAQNKDVHEHLPFLSCSKDYASPRGAKSKDRAAHVSSRSTRAVPGAQFLRIGYGCRHRCRHPLACCRSEPDLLRRAYLLFCGKGVRGSQLAIVWPMCSSRLRLWRRQPRSSPGRDGSTVESVPSVGVEMEKMSQGRYLIIGGTTKAGTTSLHAYLNDHPQVCASSIKETRFFLDRDYPLEAKYRSDDGLEYYEEYFAHRGAAAVRVEATPDYLYSPGTPVRLAAALPRAAVVFSLREPVARLVSWFRFARQSNRLPAGESFDEYVTRQFEGALPANPPQQLRALEQGRYAGYVRRFRDVLGAERVLVTYHEDLATDPRQVMRAICRFAELDGTLYDGYRFTAKNRTMDL